MLVFITLLYFLVNSNAESQHFFFLLLLLLCILFSVVTYVTDMTRGKEREQERQGVEEKQRGRGTVRLSRKELRRA